MTWSRRCIEIRDLRLRFWKQKFPALRGKASHAPVMGFFFPFWCGDGLGGIFCLPPLLPDLFPSSSQKLPEMFPTTPTFYPLCFAQTSTPFNMDYNPRVHIYFYFETGVAKSCSMFPKNLLMAQSVWLFQKKIKSPCPWTDIWITNNNNVV